MNEPAAAVAWLDWTREAFARAEAEQKPILLSIGASWCSSCHEMDRTSYADPAIAALINERFVPIRVDADRRPDITERYSLGGWPTTAFLTPSGEILGGGTYVPPDRFVQVLRQVADAFATRRAEIDAQADETGRRRGAERDAPAGAGPDVDAPAWIASRMIEEFDETHGGFGVEPKFPHADALALAIAELRARPDRRLERVVVLTLDAVGSGGLYDDVEGGFFRYCTTRDWMRPHTEKMLETNAALLRVYLEAWSAFGHASHRERAVGVLRYVHATLADRAEGGFFASQQADDRYYGLHSREERRGVPAPSVDRSLYADLNGQMAAAYLLASARFDDSSLAEFAIRSLERVLEAAYERGRGVAHFVDAGSRLEGLLADQVYVSAALLEAFEAARRDVYLDLAQELILFALRHLWDERGGGFFDRVSGHHGTDVGLLREPLKPLVANCEAARVLARLAVATGRADLHDRAVTTLAALAGAYRRHGPFGAPYGLAVRDVLARSV